MTSHLITFALVLSGCAQTGTGPLLPSDAGLPADVHALAVAPFEAPPPPAAEDVAGVAFVPTSTSQSWAAVALPMTTPSLTQTVWVRQVQQAVPDLSVDGVRLTTTRAPGLVVWQLDGPQEGRVSALSSLLTAIAAPALSDDGLAGALSTRPHSSDPADPVTLRTLHEQTAVKQRLWVSADASGRDIVAQVTGAWQAGEPLDDGDTWLDNIAEGYARQATCQVNNVGGASAEETRVVAKAAISHRAAASTSAVPTPVEAWRSGQPDVVGAMHQRIDQAPLPDVTATSDCAFPYPNVR